jgi:hypothetical protein
MKKSTALTLAGLMAISGAASASMSRWNGFGDSKAFIADVGDIWTLPAVVAANPNATYFEFGDSNVSADSSSNYNNRPNNPWGGAHLTLGPGVLAIWGNRPADDLGLLSGISTPTNLANNASSSLRTPQQQVDLIYAFGINDNTTLGIGLNRAVNSYLEDVNSSGTTVYKEEDSASDFGISLGADIKNVGPIALLEVGLQYNMISYLNSANNGSTTDKYTGSASSIDLRIGGDIKGEKNSFQRFELGLNTDSLSVKSEPNATPPADSWVESKSSAMAWNLGWAKGMSSDKGMGLGGLMLTSTQWSTDQANDGGPQVTDKYDENWTKLEFVCAGEGKIKEWLTARAGISTNLWDNDNYTYTNGPNSGVTKDVNNYTGNSNTTLTTGLSLVFGDITIDGVLNQDVLYTGGYLFSGIQAALFEQVSATWAWGGAKE